MDVGFSWQSIDGEKTIVAKSSHPTTGAPSVLVSVGDSPYPHVIAESELAAEIARDARIMERLSKRDGARQAEPTLSRAEQWGEFVAQFSAAKRSRADAVLDRGVSIGGKLGARGNLIAELVTNGWRVRLSPFKSVNGRVLSKRDAYFTEKDVTKIGMDFALFLQSKL